MSATGADSKWHPVRAAARSLVPSGARRRISAWAVIAAGVVAGLIAGLALSYVLRPSGAEVRAAARSLVPPGAQVTTDQETTGHPLVVPYYVHIVFNGGAPSEEALVREVEEVAREAGWSMTGRREAPGATLLHYVRGGVDARVSVARNRERIAGVLSAQRDEPTENRRLALSSVTGALVGGTTAALYRRSRRGDKE